MTEVKPQTSEILLGSIKKIVKSDWPINLERDLGARAPLPAKKSVLLHLGAGARGQKNVSK